MQESRLFGIVYELLEKGKVSAPELAKRFEVSVRTIYRDIDSLCAAGIPVCAETGRMGGFGLMPGFVLSRAVLSEQEKQEILTALRSVDIMKNGSGSDILHKLSALFGLHAEDWIEVDFSRWGEMRHDNEKFELLKTAILQRKKVYITYAGVSGNVDGREVEPLKLYYKSRAWYLKAFCQKRQDFRLFRLNRILELSVLQEGFLPREFPSCEDAKGPECGMVTLRFPAEMAYRVYDEFDADHVKRQENGDLIASAPFLEDAWLTGFLLSFGDKVDVIAPAHLKDVLAGQAKRIYEKNIKG